MGGSTPGAAIDLASLVSEVRPAVGARCGEQLMAQWNNVVCLAGLNRCAMFSSFLLLREIATQLHCLERARFIAGGTIPRDS